MDGSAFVHQRQYEHLHLNVVSGYYVHKDLVSVLSIHQLEGVRFLYTQLQEYTGIFLNDESGLGKCHQIVAYLSAVSAGALERSIILSRGTRRHHWSYHLDALAPTLATRVYRKSYAEAIEDLDTLQATAWQYVVVDETRGFMTDRELDVLRSLTARKYIFLCSTDLLESLGVLSERLEFCYPWDTAHLRTLIERCRTRGTKQRRLRLYLCTRPFLLRRHVRNYRRVVPLVGSTEFAASFHAWTLANDIVIGREVEEKEASPNEQEIASEREQIPAESNGRIPPIDTAFCEVGGEKKPVKKPPLKHGQNSTKSSSGFVPTGIAFCEAQEEEQPASKPSQEQGRISPEANEEFPLLDIAFSGTLEGEASKDRPPQNVGRFSSESSIIIPPINLKMTPDAEVKTGRMERNASPDRGSEPGLLRAIDSEPLFEPNETNTELMPELRLESDTSEERAAVLTGASDVTIPETIHNSEEFVQCAQEFSSFGSANQPVLATDRYRFPLEKFFSSQGLPKSSSSSISFDSLSNGQAPAREVVISSSGSQSLIPKSPPLFEESDHDTRSLSFGSSPSADGSDDDILLLDDVSKSLVPCATKPLPGHKLCQPQRFSTPISKLMFGALAPGTSGLSQPVVNVSSADMFADSPMSVDDENVFEITKNSAFANRIRVRGEDKGAPLLRLDDDDDTSGDDDDVQFVNESRPDIIVDLEDEHEDAGTPKSDVLNRTVVCMRTPTSGRSNQSVSPGRGWLGKSLRTASVSPGSGKSTPTSSKQSPRASSSGANTRNDGVRRVLQDVSRRRKLDEQFKSTLEGHGVRTEAKRGRDSPRKYPKRTRTKAR
ncbi:uncharacterized protein LOC128724757 [Anopheles nili]|uniref:uncharacterized protein LOC128724757 n=1 Tax=Anopheles nili TaxID=185578 RepID=UPI00237BBE1B|nr:uncharacterized protein LOC128724757 [Anopheles nili]